MTRVGFDDTPRAILESDDREFQLADEVIQQFGSDENDCFVVVRSDQIADSDTLEWLGGFAERLAATSGVSEVISIADARFLLFDPLPRSLIPSSLETMAQRQRFVDDVARHPIARNFLNRAGDTTVVLVRLSGENLAISEIAPVVERLRAVLNRARSETEHTFYLTGLPVVRAEIFSSIEIETRWFLVVGISVGALMSVLLFRRWRVLVILGIATWAGAIWTFGSLGWIGQRINVLTTVLPTLILMIGLTDAIHLAVHFIQLRRGGSGREDAARGTLADLATACAMTSLTTAVGFGSLVITNSPIIRDFGVTCAWGTSVMLAAVVLLVPLGAATRLGAFALPNELFGVLSRGKWLTEQVLRFRWPISCAGFLLVAGLVVISTRLTPDSQLAESLPRHFESYRGLEIMDEQFGGVLTSAILIEWDGAVGQNRIERAIFEAQQIFQEHPDFRSSSSLLDLKSLVPLGSTALLPEQLRAQFFRPELQRALVKARIRDRGAAYFKNQFVQLKRQLAQLEQRFDGFRFTLTGTSVVATFNLVVMIGDLAASLALAGIIIFVVLSIVLKSIRLGLIAVIPNFLPLLLTSSFLVVAGEPLRMTSVVVFTVCLGIAVDDTIHVLVRFRRAYTRHGSPFEAARSSVLEAGRALIITSLILLVGFVCVFTSEMPHNRWFAGLAILIILSALVGDLIILPALLCCFVPDRSGDFSSRPFSDDAAKVECG